MNIIVSRGNIILTMKYFNLILLSLFLLLLQPSYAESKDIKLDNYKYDEVSIGYIPARYASSQGEPQATLVARVLTHHRNKEIEKFFTQLNKLASAGTTDNATHFHQPTKYIEAIFQGERVRLFLVSGSNLEKFKHYEKSWKVLHSKMYEYLIQEISPNGQGD